MASSGKSNAKRSPGVPLRAWLAAALVLLSQCTAGSVRAQQPPSPKEAPLASQVEAESTTRPDEAKGSQPDAVGPRATYVGPDTYILLDAEGRPQPMPGMTYEDFLAAWKRLHEPIVPDDQPRYAIEDMIFRGRVIGQRAELECRITVRLMGSGPVNVPLGLVGAIVHGEPKFSAVAEESRVPAADAHKSRSAEAAEFLTSDPDHGGYIARFQGDAGNKRTLSLNLIVPLAHDGPETSLPINCPRAVSSQLELDLDAPIREARVNTGSLFSQEANTKGGTTVKVAGLSGLFRLTWLIPTNESSAVASVLNALGTVHVTIDGRGIRSDARLTVRSYGGSFDQFRVRLPAGAQLVQARPDTTQSPNVHYRIRVEDKSGATVDKNSMNRQVVVVELTEKQQGPVIVDLATEYVGRSEDQGQGVDVGGFEVLGAVRQFGDVALSVADDWQARWEIGSFVRQVDPNELDSTLQSFNPTAAFQYDRQPWSLNLRLARRQLRVHVTPRFEMECLPEEARLTVTLNYQVFGSRAFEFRVALNGWELTGDPVESASLVDTERIAVTPEGTLLLPLVQASARRAEVSFTLRKVVDRDAKRLELPLPVPAADSIGTGELVVHSAPEINLLPDLPNSTGLTAAATLQDGENLPNDGTAELHYRTLLPAAVFTADRTNRTRDITTQTATQIVIADDSAKIDQRFDYTVRFEPIGELTFEVGVDFPVGPAELEVLLMIGGEGESEPNGQAIPLQANPAEKTKGASVDETAKRLRVKLPRPLMGRFSVWTRYRDSLPKREANEQHWLAPLVRAADGQSVTNAAEIRWAANVTVVLDDGPSNPSWKVVPATDQRADGLGLSILAEHPAATVPLTVRAASPKPPATTIVERAWLQTWLSKGVVQNRAAFRIRTAGSQATVELPPETAGAETEVLVNRQQARILSRAPGRLVIQLGAETEAAPHDGLSTLSTYTIELRSRQEYRRSLVTLHHLTPPQIEGSIALSQVYWQLVVPSDEHVIGEPAQLASASEWQWLGAFWGRRPLKSQADLEEWSGASQQAAPTASQNQYLFSGIIPVSSIGVTTAPRWLIVLTASAATLIMAVVCLYLSKAHRRWLLALLAVAITITAMIYPGATFMMAQASMLGLLLAGLSLVISQIARRPPTYRAAPVVSPSSHRLTTQRSEPIVMPPLLGATSTAPTASLRASESWE